MQKIESINEKLQSQLRASNRTLSIEKGKLQRRVTFMRRAQEKLEEELKLLNRAMVETGTAEIIGEWIKRNTKD